MFRDRIKELRRVPASELLANPKNWRTHPPSQSEALKAVLRQVGIAGAVLAYETAGGLCLVDGHLRQELITDQPVPVLVLDCNEAEAGILLATYDPLSSLAEMDSQALIDLLEDVKADDAVLKALLDNLGQDAADKLLAEANDGAPAEAPEPAPTSEGEYNTFTAPLTVAQEQVVRQALRVAKQKRQLDKTGDALAVLAQDFLAANPSA